MPNDARKHVRLPATSVLILIGVCILVATTALFAWLKANGARGRGDLADWRYVDQLHRQIAGADRIEVRHGWVRDGELAETKLLFTVTDPNEVSAVYRHLTFDAEQQFAQCGCVGLLRINWYTKDRLLAATSLMHGKSFRSDTLAGDTTLEAKSARWIVKWLKRHGLSEGFILEPPFPERELAEAG